ncbi:MAG: polyribonucleotide nucleotidyltransferase, partial [Thermodesulfobacteriota bacterium]|nr:polyribonucleotide nucleotidyltransferase [Thermodesulfobacteriota bacterium]
MVQVVEIEFSGKKFSIEHGRVARQTNGAVLVRYSDTMVLVTVVSAEEAKEESYFLPLIVDYVEMTYAAGKIPGGFFKREGRPTERETLISRLIDRSIRPLFLENFHNDVQVIATVLSVDQENDPDVIAIVGASAALTVSDIPFSNPVAGVRIGRVDGDFICNPTYIQRKKSDIDIIVAGTKSVIVMVEGSVDILPEDVVLDAIMFAHEAMQPLLSLQESLQNQVSNDKREFPSFKIEVELAEKIKGTFFKRVEHALSIPEKTRRKNEIHHIEKDAVLQFSEELGLKGQEVIAVLDDLQRAIVRDNYSREKIRIDGRKFHEIRPITCEVGVLPRVHGSAIFTRGETQVLVATTLGTTADEQRLDSLSGESSKSFMLHYNFLPFSVGEVRFLRAPSRREIGHGALAEKAISIVLPESDEFPYTIR